MNLHHLRPDVAAERIEAHEQWVASQPRKRDRKIVLAMVGRSGTYRVKATFERTER